MSIGAVVLAAGLSKRMGKPKQLLELDGKPLFLHAVDLAIMAGLMPITVVTGQYHTEMTDLLKDRKTVDILYNEEYTMGMGNSLRKGIRHMEEKTVNAAFVMLADQPFIPLSLLHKMIQAYNENRSEDLLVFQPQYTSGPGHPVLFDRALFHEFKQLEGDTGGKGILQKYKYQMMRISGNDDRWNFDIDQPQDYEQAMCIINEKI